MFSRVYFGRYFAPTYFGPQVASEIVIGVEPLELDGRLSRERTITGRYAPTMAVHGIASRAQEIQGTW
jgi:hypothetical protein